MLQRHTRAIVLGAVLLLLIGGAFSPVHAQSVVIIPTVTTVTSTPDRLGVWGFPAALARPGFTPVATFQISYVEPGSPAEQIGLRVGDKILNVAGIQVYDTASFCTAMLQARNYSELHVSFERAATGELRQSWSRFYLDPLSGRYLMFSKTETSIPTSGIWPLIRNAPPSPARVMYYYVTPR